MVVLNDVVKCNLWNILTFSNKMNMDKFNIVSIVIDDSFEYKVTKVNNDECEINYIEIGSRYFIENILENPNNFDFWSWNINTLYILRDSSYTEVKDLFNTINNTNVKIVKGNSQKSHFLNPMEFRLSCYLMIIFNMDFKKFNYENSFNILRKIRYIYMEVKHE